MKTKINALEKDVENIENDKREQSSERHEHKKLGLAAIVQITQNSSRVEQRIDQVEQQIAKSTSACSSSSHRPTCSTRQRNRSSPCNSSSKPFLHSSFKCRLRLSRSPTTVTLPVPTQLTR
jgi:hypothetical protein